MLVEQRFFLEAVVKYVHVSDMTQALLSHGFWYLMDWVVTREMWWCMGREEEQGKLDHDYAADCNK